MALVWVCGEGNCHPGRTGQGRCSALVPCWPSAAAQGDAGFNPAPVCLALHFRSGRVLLSHEEGQRWVVCWKVWRQH